MNSKISFHISTFHPFLGKTCPRMARFMNQSEIEYQAVLISKGWSAVFVERVETIFQIENQIQPRAILRRTDISHNHALQR